MQARIINLLFCQLGLTCLFLLYFQESMSVIENYLRHNLDSEKASQVKSFIEYLERRIEGEN